MKKPKTKKKAGRPSTGKVRIHLMLTPIVAERLNADSKREGYGVSIVADRALRIGLGIDG